MTLSKRLLNLIQKWAANLGISDYKFGFKLVAERDISGDYARVDTDDDTREVSLEFNRTRLMKEPHEVEKTVVHELLHCRLNELAEFMIDVTKEYVPGSKEKRLIKKQLEKLEHKAVVAITEALLNNK